MAQLDVERLAREFAAGPARLRSAWDRVPPEARGWRPGTGRWSAHEVVIHCADATVNSAARLRYLLAEDDPVLVGYDQDRWCASLRYEKQSVDLAFATIDAVTAATVPLWRGLTPADLARPGRHTESGNLTLASWLPPNAAHLATHAQQIERNVAAWRTRG